MKLLGLKSFSLTAILAFSACLLAQEVSELDNLKKQYVGSNILLKNHKETIKIDLGKNGPVYRSIPIDEYVILNQSAIEAMSNDEIYFTSFDSIEFINAYTMIPKGDGKFKKVKATNFQTKAAEQEGNIFHDDSKLTSFMFPSLVEGAHRYVEYSELSLENKFPFSFYFSAYIPVETSEFTIDMDSSIHVITSLMNDIEGIKFEEKLEKDRRILKWSISNPKKLKDDTQSTNSRYYAPHIVGQIAYYIKDGKKINVLSNTDDLHNWYVDHIENVVNEKPSEELKSVVDSLIVGKENSLDKMKAIYYWVQSNIKYIAFEEGEGGFVPREACQIFKKRYGDCKDMSTLIYAMSKYANLPVYLTWIGTRDIPYKYSEFPSTACDNHMIATYFDKDKPIYLDATASFLPYNYPSFGIQGKEALIHINEKEYKLLTVPVLHKNFTSSIDSSFVSFENQKLIGRNIDYMKGYYNFYMNELYKDLDSVKLVEYVQSLHKKGNNTFKVKDIQFKNLGEREKELRIDFDFEIDNYVTSYKDEVYVNLILHKEISHGEFKADRLAPFELASFSQDKYIVVLEIPEGYELVSLPKDVSYSNEEVKFKLFYKLDKEKNQVICELELDLEFLVLYPTKFKEWNEFYKIQKKAFNETVVLKKKA